MSNQTSNRTSKSEDIAFNKAARYLSYGTRSINEINRYLESRGLSDFREPVIERMTNAGLLDDERLVERWILQRADAKSLGRVRIRIELLKKGIDSELVNSKLDDLFDPDMERIRAINAASKRIRQLRDVKPDAVGRRLYTFLKTKGFEDETCRYAIERVLNPI